MNQAVCKQLDLSSFLLLPMQRITRYSLLLRQILHYTPKSHSDHETTLIALQMSDEFLEKVNRDTLRQQSQLKIQQIVRSVDLEVYDPQNGNRLDLLSQTKSVGERLYLFEGSLTKNKSGRKVVGYLFNDMLLLCETKPASKQLCIYRQPLLIGDMLIQEAKAVPNRDVGTIDKCCFQLITKGDVITLRAGSASEKRQWMNQVSDAIKKHSAQEKKIKSGRSNQEHHEETVGTLKLALLKGRGLAVEGGTRSDVFAILQLADQIVRSKKVDGSRPIWNQAVMFSVFSLDQCLKIAVYQHSKYSTDGNCSVIKCI